MDMTLTALDTELRDQFPILRQDVHGNPLVYLDNGYFSKAQTSGGCPGQCYQGYNANITGVHA